MMRLKIWTLVLTVITGTGAGFGAIMTDAQMAGSAAASSLVNGNDTGGIIPWSRETEYHMRAIAGAHCAQYDKHAHITSVYRQYGAYIGFACHFNRPVIYRERPLYRERRVILHARG
jgi:hypothetical protein